MPSVFRVTEGVEPVRQTSADFTEMAQQLRQLLKQLIHQEAIRPEQIVLLSPYRHTNSTSTWAEGLRDVIINLDMATSTAGQVRVGTIHGFKGLEADVVILVGLNQQAKQHPEWLYVGATRARASLFVLALLGAVDV
ncbi:MAG: ATP-binding domain-containing protein, partial [Flavobacteriales bacterium]